MSTLIKKISIKTVLKARPAVPEKNGEVNQIMDLIGIANGVQPGETDKGPYNRFIGSFQATNLKTGEVYRSGSCFMPDVAGNLILGALKGGASSVEFGFKIGVVKDDQSATGYVYVAEPLMKPSENDPLELLNKKVNVPQLEHDKEHGGENKKK